MVEVEGRTILSNGCRYGDDCFDCKQKDCRASASEILVRDSGASDEDIDKYIQHVKKQKESYQKKYRAKLKQEKLKRERNTRKNK